MTNEEQKQIDDLKAEIAALKQQIATWKPFRVALRLEDRQIHMLNVLAQEDIPPDAPSPFTVVPRQE